MQSKDNYLHCLKDSPDHTVDLNNSSKQEWEKQARILWMRRFLFRFPSSLLRSPLPFLASEPVLQGVPKGSGSVTAAAPKSDADLHFNTTSCQKEKWNFKEKVLKVNPQVGRNLGDTDPSSGACRQHSFPSCALPHMLASPWFEHFILTLKTSHPLCTSSVEKLHIFNILLHFSM